MLIWMFVDCQHICFINLNCEFIFEKSTYENLEKAVLEKYFSKMIL